MRDNLTDRFSCYLIGEDSLVCCCAKMIIEHGHNLLGICSPSEQVKDLALQSNISYTSSLETFESWLLANKCDFLFSVVNSIILSKNIIKSPRCFAINYHNAPLPKYAGVHATSWAILNNERYHGVTWHILDEKIDAGDILKQTIFKIDAQDTNFTLDVKCIEHAVPLFNELLLDLAQNKCQRIKQDPSQRNYYTLYKKPKHWGVISWLFAAEEINTLYRALNFSGYANKLCLPKFVLNDLILFPKKIKVSKKENNLPAGTIVEISAHCLRIATASDDVEISQIVDINGNPYDIFEFVKLYNLKKGTILPTLKQNFLYQLELYSESLAKSESFWVQALTKIKNINFLSLSSPGNHVGKKNSIKKLVYSQDKPFKNITDNYGVNTLTTILLLYIYRLNNYEDFSVGYRYHFCGENGQNMPLFFADVVPINLDLIPHIHFEEALSKIDELIALIKQHKTFAKDVILRYPQLTGCNISFPIVIDVYEQGSEEGAKNKPLKNCLHFIVSEKQILLYFPNNLDSVTKKIVANITGHLKIFAKDLLFFGVAVNKASILTKQEENLIIKNWNNTYSPYPRKLSVVDIFEQQVNKYSNNIALKFNSTSLTYKELNQRANQLGYYLTTLGVKNGSLVATYFDKGINSIISILSILKAGAAYVPIDPIYPKQHIQYILGDTGVVVVLTQEQNKKVLERCLPTGKFILLSINDAKANFTIFNDKHEDNLATSAIHASLAYIMYTSGSTGLPKGVMITHKGITRLVKNSNYIRFSCDDCVAQVASISFDAATFEIWGALLNGAKLVCAEIDTILDANKFAYFLEAEKVSITFLTSALFDQHASVNPAMFRSLKYLLVGGDVLNVDAINTVVDCLAGSPQYVVNGYGPTENTTFTATFLIKEKFDKAIPIGKPLSNTTVYILDKCLNHMPIGIPGELYAGGDGLSLGYWNKENLTKEKFIDLSIVGKQVRLYRTGDLVRWQPSGNLDFICRIDNQVKIRGFRVELEAIELCLLNCNVISQCAVVVRQDSKNNKLIVAYIVAKNQDDIDIAYLREFLAANLPPYMLPNAFVIMDKLPLNVSGKVDKKGLPSLKFHEQMVANQEHCIYPQNELEKKLSDIWKELLSLDAVCTNDDFFYLGGHSLLITQMIMKIRQFANTDLPLSEFLEQPTINNLAKLIETKQNLLTSITNSKSSIPKTFINDISLDNSIIPLSSELSPVANKPKTVLLTGATGFLGAHLLNDLYRLSDTKIYCLVKANNLHDAYQRITSVLEKYKFSKINTNNHRVIVLLGDLAKPLLGVNQKTFDMLGEELDYIYHCGAYVHHFYHYDMLRMANVLSTVEIVKLATYKKNKHIHYISTLATAINYVDENGLILENFLERDKLSLHALNGYAQTKLASEIILTEAHKRNIQVSIYRPAWITGDSSTGILAIENNHLFLLIKGCIQMGYAPKLQAKLNMLPVDFVSNFIVKTSLYVKDIKPKVFNLISSYPLTWVELFEYINNRNLDVKLVSTDEWRQKHLPKIDISNALYSLVSLYLADGGIAWANEQNKFSNALFCNTKLAMNVCGLNYIKIDAATLDHYFDFLKKIGFI